MNRFDFCFTVIAIAIFSCHSYAQVNLTDQKSNQTHFITGVGGSYVNVLDEGISPLLYKGSGGSVVLGHFRETQKNVSSSLATFHFNNPSSSISGADMYTYRLEGKYQHYWKIKKNEEKKWKVRPGVSGTANWNLRQHRSFTNNSQHIETRFSVAPAIMITRPFTLWKRDFEFGLFNQLPLITYATRPLFASTKFPASVNKEKVDFYDYLLQGELVSFGKYFKWSAQTYLLFPLKSGNALRLDYFWAFESYNAINPIRTGEHAIMISTFFKL